MAPESLRFARNPDYWGAQKAEADSIRVRIIPEALTIAAEYEAGLLHVAEVPFSETDNLALEFRYHKAQIVAAVGGSQSPVSVFVQQDQWREYVHNGVLTLPQSTH